MEMTHEEKKELTILHDQFAKAFNDYTQKLTLIIRSRESIPEDDYPNIENIRVRIGIIRDQCEAVDAVIDDLGMWYRTYKTHRHIMRHAASRPINLD